MEAEEESGFSQRLTEAQAAWNSAADAESVATPLRWLADNASPAALSLGQQEVRAAKPRSAASLTSTTLLAKVFFLLDVFEAGKEGSHIP